MRARALPGAHPSILLGCWVASPENPATCRLESAPQVVQALLAAYPAGAGEKDATGKLPVRLALEKKVTEEVVGALLEAAEELYKSART